MGFRMMSAMLVVSCLFASSALAQQHSRAADDLDVTMHIIVDPDAKVPDDIVRRIPLPVPKPAQPAPSSAGKDRTLPDAANKGQARADQARELGREVAERAREHAEQAAEQREQARRSVVEERRREPPPPRTPGPGS